MSWRGSRMIASVAVIAALSACGPDPQAAGEPTEVTAATTTVDAYGRDPNRATGTRAAVCRDGEAANRVGRAALAAYIDERWPEVIEVLGYECREIHYPSDPACLGRSEPEHSTCWSTHAAGRAIDVVVGGEPDEPTPHGLVVGNEIVSAFLASEGGVEHHLARVAGVQEILWNGRCWHPEDRAVVSAADMEVCGVSGHSDHIHLTLSDAGADGLTSWHGE